MTERKKIPVYYDDYVQSANSVFHFMDKMKYLEDIMRKKALVPRYCIEDVEYLNLTVGGKTVDKLAVLEKCFCDIPFHNLTMNFNVTGVGEEYERLTDEQKNHLKQNNTHTACYGEYGVAFSKEWCENNCLQPIQYINDRSEYARGLSKVFDEVMAADDLPDTIADDIISRMCFMKPIRGIMTRIIKTADEDVQVSIYKNFHDEMEWRYVPSERVLAENRLEKIIRKKSIIENKQEMDNINSRLNTERYSDIWLRFKYEDIRYIIVPNKTERNNFIKMVYELPDELFDAAKNVQMQRGSLISKLEVLDDIRKDW